MRGGGRAVRVGQGEQGRIERLWSGSKDVHLTIWMAEYLFAM